MEKTTIGAGQSYLYGHVNGDRFMITNTVEQITAFIMKYRYEDTIITDIFDNMEIVTMPGGFIMTCPNQQFLSNELIPYLSPVQMGEEVADEFVPHVEEVQYVIQNVIMTSGAGSFLGSVSYEEGYPQPYERKTGYFRSTEKVKEAYPDALSEAEAHKIAQESGWTS